MRVGVLAVQGAFAEMAAYWRAQDADTFEIRQLADLERDIDLLALPGGESTVQGKLLHDLGLFEPLKERIQDGLPAFAVCAGLILLAEKVEDDGGRPGVRPSQCWHWNTVQGMPANSGPKQNCSKNIQIRESSC